MIPVTADFLLRCSNEIRNGFCEDSLFSLENGGPKNLKDVIETAANLYGEKTAFSEVREKVPVSKLKIGLKCGGSDGYSGITANAVVGKVTDRLCAMGASAVLTEVPEMFGAETVLFERCVSRDVFDKRIILIRVV